MPPSSVHSSKTSKRVRIGTRKSKLARIQTDILVSRLQLDNPDIQFEVVLVTTGGDLVRDRPIAEVGESGVFVKELEEALQRKDVDFVVHSLKDLPTDMPDDLTLACVYQREDPRDVIVSANGVKFADLPKAATVATSSRRRMAQLAAHRKDLTFIDIRGNVPTRLKKHDDGQCDAIVLAAAGLLRLGLQHRISEYLELDVCLPAVGQGALATQCRKDDQEICNLLESVDEATTRSEIVAERAFLKRLGGGCSVPVGGLAQVKENKLTLFGCIAALDGSKVQRKQLTGAVTESEQLGNRLAELMLKEGGEAILCALKASPANLISPP